ncbi:uncharacterized protein NECHADRAFT_84105 [Fusarium vanettenii 77-13-4]|uniref:DNA 3'-5' helicase n=1 Tax=Fusarium vanettenii (strain ATCC MYA-4622 / CBS 123669 / FGSC 9596 / NRRL 45880 / 77-13-4) TaxID=660122 RepID=C7YZQ1_FUSV7|nr:uncharacterized protein NECHADRAFT_84105 [Fusarium vanettenii 77-13-4]EEU42837.1 hypothetical protein NECHADRAFT_84105 [Fusarium vanettenii 77-13-4]
MNNSKAREKWNDLPVVGGHYYCFVPFKYGEQGEMIEEIIHHSDLDLDRQTNQLASLATRVSDDTAKLILHNPTVSITEGQRRAFEAISAGTGENVIFMAPTGLGKTLIYILPAFLEPTGITIVVYPLKALQHNQAARLRAAGITVEIWNDTMR